MNIARIEAGTVINLEIASEGWVTRNESDPAFEFIPYDETNPAYIGLGWTLADGFEQPAAPEIP